MIELNVGGSHYTTLLSTLTKDADSNLAAMFTGKLPVYKDKDGRYFLDGDGKLFQYILDYLRTGTFPYEVIPNTGGFGFGGHSNFPHGIDKISIALYKEAVLFGLKALEGHLEQYKGMYIEKQLESFRKSKTGYEECMSKVLQAIPVTSMLGNSYTIVVLKQMTDGQPARHCEHSCAYNYPTENFLRPPQVSSKDLAIVEVPCTIDHTVLNCLYLDLTRIGFNVNCGVSECNFHCEEAPRNVFGSFSFGSRVQRQCCREPVFYIQINWSLAPFAPVFNNKGFSFGGGQAVSTPFTGFGTPAQTGCFGNPQNNKGGGSIFGSQQNNTGQSGLFGSQQNSQNTSGFGQSGFGQSAVGQEGSLFGSQQSSSGQTSFFGSQPQSQTCFGFGQSRVGAGFGTFGSQQNSSGPSGFGSVFGGGAKTGSDQSSFSFGGQTQNNQSSGFTFGQKSQSQQSQVEETRRGFSFGSGVFGNPSKQGFSQEASAQSGESTSTGTARGFSFGTPHMFGQPPSTVENEDSASQQSFTFKGFTAVKDEQDL